MVVVPNNLQSVEMMQTEMKKRIKVVVAVVAAILAWLVPSTAFGLPNLTPTEQRMLAIALFGAVMWVTEAIELWKTSVMVIVLMLLFVSDCSLSILSWDRGANLSDDKVAFYDIMASFANPVLMLFLGGLILAMAARKVGLDVKLARLLLRPFGEKCEDVMLGFMMVCAILSMFMNNTATAALMFAIISPVISAMPNKGSERLPLLLSIPIATNLGGMATPVGTPVNLIAMHYINDPNGINMGLTFGGWVFYMLPLTIFMLFISWLLLIRLFPFKQKCIYVDIPNQVDDSRSQTIVTITFACTVLMWMFDSYIGLNTYIIGMVPIMIFTLTGIFGKEDLKIVKWDILWLMAGGFALGTGFNQTGLAKDLLSAIPLGDMSPWVIAVTAGVVAYIMSSFISNTATAFLLVPIVTSGILQHGMVSGDEGVGAMIIMVIAVSSSFAMSLPISTPPNALVYSVAGVRQKDMIKIGTRVGLICMVLSFALFGYMTTTSVL